MADRRIRRRRWCNSGPQAPVQPPRLSRWVPSARSHELKKALLLGWRTPRTMPDHFPPCGFENWIQWNRREGRFQWGLRTKLFKTFHPWQPDHRRNAGAGAQAAQCLQRRNDRNRAQTCLSWRGKTAPQRAWALPGSESTAKSHFGYKLSISVDKTQDHPQDRDRPLASTHDCPAFRQRVRRATRAVTCMPTRAIRRKREDWLKANSTTSRSRERANATNRCPSASNNLLKRITQDSRTESSTCSGAIEQMGGKLLRHPQTGANFAMTMMAACAQPEAAGLFRKVWNGRI